MKKILMFTLLVILLGMSALVSSAQNKDTAAITDFILKQATQEGGAEYKGARKIVRGDLDRDGIADLVVLYTIEGQNGSNNYVQYLAVFSRNKDGLVPVTHTVVGGKTNRSVELKSIKNNVISLKTLSYEPNDASCCPSKKGATTFVLVNSELKEQ